MSHVAIDAVELLREPGTTHLSPTRLARLLEIEQSVLARALGVHPSIMRMRPHSRRTQEGLVEFNRVLQILLQLHDNPTDAVYHMKNTPIHLLEQRTLFEALAEGDSAKVVRYLDTISGGQNG